jgi:hypothetical protein
MFLTMKFLNIHYDLSFLLGLSSVYPLTVGVEGYWCTWSHSDTSHSVGLLWTRDRPPEENCTWQNTTLTTHRHPRPRQNSNPRSRKASGDCDTIISFKDLFYNDVNSPWQTASSGRVTGGTEFEMISNWSSFHRDMITAFAWRLRNARRISVMLSGFLAEIRIRDTSQLIFYGA